MNYIKIMPLRAIMFIVTFILVFVNTYAKTNNSWDGHWLGENSNGDMVVELTISKDTMKSLNPYDQNSMSNAFMTVYVVEPSGRRTVLTTYEFVLTGETDTTLNFDFKGGRSAVDNASGKCNVMINGETLVFIVTDSVGDQVLFANMQFSKDGTVVTDSGETSKKSEDIMGIIVGILILLVFIGMAGHMLYLLFRGDRYKKVFTVDDMRVGRVAQNKPEQMSEEEYNNAVKLLEDAFEQWSVVEHDENGDERRKPTKMKQIKNSVSLIDQVIALQPTEEDILTRLNDMTDVINSSEHRYFDGSKALVWLGIIVGILFCFIMGPGTGIITIMATGIYVIASRTPVFLIEKRSKRGGGNIHNGFIAGIFAMIAGAKTIRTVTEYSDGSKKVEDDHSQHWIAWILGIMLLVAIASFMFVWAIINYIRNYVLYF